MLKFTPEPKVRCVISLLYEGGARECIFVGGFVRDILLGLSPKDVDIEVYGLTYKRIHQILKRHFSVNYVGQSFGTIKVDNEIDISVPRRESKSGVGHKGFNISCDPNLDLYSAFSRRDFTINAIGIRMDNSIYDPFGGIGDIENKVLRAPTEAFCDDPLRVLRGMQFAARFGFTMESNTVEFCKHVFDEFVTLSVERVWGEWSKWGLKGIEPSRGLFLLRETGWIRHFPEIANLISEANPVVHIDGGIDDNLFTNTARICDFAVKVADELGFDVEERLVLVFAALCYNFGKPDLDAADNRASKDLLKQKLFGTISNLRFDSMFSGVCFVDGLRLARRFLERLKPPLRVVDRVLAVVGEGLTDGVVLGECVVSDEGLRRLAVRLEPSSIRIWAALCRAIILAGGKTNLTSQVSKCELRAEELGIFRGKPKPILQGRDLIARGVKAGKKMGIILNNAYEAQLDGTFNNIDEAINWYNLNHDK
ncbi:MAG: hypothetical protein LBJ00_13050 [Planctomycetaceae bacterium]|jgi:tRNA nucleotidyltransferase (CCA-adding enzyme)|nr:hypothetical protein [Planctomycetaceae bacterium]